MMERYQLLIPDGKDTYDGWHVYAQTENADNPGWLSRVLNIRSLQKENQITAYMVVRHSFDMESGVYVTNVLEHKTNPLRPRIVLNPRAKRTPPKREGPTPLATLFGNPVMEMEQ